MGKGEFKVVIPDYKYWKQNIKCQTGCPVNTDSRGYVRAIAEGDYEKAYWIARTPNPLASICGRVCAAPCELACRRKGIDAAISIRALKRFVTEKYGTEMYKDKNDFVSNLTKTLKKTGSAIIGIAADNSKPVSIVGAGPAGLACAHDLALMGYKPVIYEMEAIGGGMCAVGIPPYRLPRDILQAEIDAIKALGVRMKFGVQVGKDIGLRELYDGSLAVLLSVGAKKARMLPLEGADGEGVIGGVDFLRSVFTGEEINTDTIPKELRIDFLKKVFAGKELRVGLRVIVIGGGNVAYDIARTSIRHKGVNAVTLVCIEEFDDMLADKAEIEEGEEEGILRINGYGPMKINLNEQNRVISVTFKRCISLYDGEGRFNPRYDESDLMTIPADTVMFAVGQVYDLSFLKESGLAIEMTERGMIKVGPDAVTTSLKGLFVAGDLAYGPKLVIDAVASGKNAALKIHEYISGRTVSFKTSEIHTERYACEVLNNEVAHPKNFEKIKRKQVPVAPVDRRLRNMTNVVETGFPSEVAREQSGRCLNCAVNTIFDGDKCILCGGCADVCPEYCLRLVSLEKIKGDDTLAALYINRYGKTPGNEGSAIIKDEDRCIRCGFCAKRCPVNAITMERFLFQEVLQDDK